MTAPGSSPLGRADRVLQGGRSKAYRPLPAAARAAAFAAGLEAYRRGDFFEANGRLEPAWMGTADPVERDLYQGLIKLAAGYVHAVRGNPTGLAINLRGARERLATAAAIDPAAGGLDLRALVAAIDARLDRAGSGRKAIARAASERDVIVAAIDDAPSVERSPR